jgi:hypothetical protein
MEKDCRLLPSQRNEVFNLIKSKELDPRCFVWKEVKSQYFIEFYPQPTIVSRLEYRGTSFFFLFDVTYDGFRSLFSPGWGHTTESSQAKTQLVQLAQMDLWLDFLKREVHQPDLWEEMLQQHVLPAGSLDPDLGNQPLTGLDIDAIRSGIDEMRTYLKEEFQGDNDALRLINDRLDYVVAASKRQGKKDWIHTSIGVFCTIAVALAMAPEQSKHLGRILGEIVSKITQFLIT